MTVAGGPDPDPGSPAPPGPDLTGPEADELLGAAAELAIEVARTGVRQQPPLEVPSRLRPLLGHAKVTRAALTTARRVVEEDPPFRSRVAAVAEVAVAEEMIGRAGVLWLCRPEGWAAELGALVGQARTAAATRAEDGEERSARRRLRHAEGARDRADQAAEVARRAAETARRELQEERRLRRAAEVLAERATRRAASLEEQLAAAHREAAAATGRLGERTVALDAAAAALASAQDEQGDLRAEVTGLQAALDERTVEDRAAGPHRDAPEDVGLDRVALGGAVAAASAAAAALGTALGRAAAALEPGSPAERNGPRDADPTPVGRPPPPTRPRSARARRVTHRRPVLLPPLVLEGSAEAAEHLVGLPGVTLLVDGYNATLTTWPELPLPEQRTRLVDALTELAARTGARPEVVFDGAEVPVDRNPAPSPRSTVKVTFTAPDVEADDVLIARAAALAQPVVVASDDRRVRDGARAAGANVLGIEQLLAALRRGS